VGALVASSLLIQLAARAKEEEVVEELRTCHGSAEEEGEY